MRDVFYPGIIMFLVAVTEQWRIKLTRRLSYNVILLGITNITWNYYLLVILQDQFFTLPVILSFVVCVSWPIVNTCSCQSIEGTSRMLKKQVRHEVNYASAVALTIFQMAHAYRTSVMVNSTMFIRNNGYPKQWLLMFYD